MLRIFALVFGLSVSLGALSAQPPPGAQAEIDHLLENLKRCGCEFYRNGSWYNAADAVAHVNMKYRYLLNKGLITNTEDFIERAASKSSISGRPYQVRCGAGDQVASERWLKEELQRYRSEQSDRKP